MRKIRVLVMEDSLTVRRYLVDVLSADAQFDVVGEAADGRAGIELCQRLKPDVATVDIVMPVMSGLAAVEYIMAYCPTPILIVSSSFNRGDVFKTLDALAAGAVDVLEKPTDNCNDAQWGQRFCKTVALVSRLKVITHPAAKLRPRVIDPPPLIDPLQAADPGNTRYDLVAIGASTGGPAALQQLLSALPKRFNLPILLVIHLDRRFDNAFVEWLQGFTTLTVRVATDGMKLPGRGDPQIIVAPADRHMIVNEGRLRLTADKERHYCRPSVDTLFESLAGEIGARTIACLLSGMGVDGAAGMLALRGAGAMTLAQDEATSIVFGMPRKAIELGAARQILPLPEFAPALVRLAALPGSERTSPDKGTRS